MTPAEAVVEMAGIVVQAKRDILTEDEVRSRAEQTRTWDDAKRFLWALRCRVASQVRLGSDKRMKLEDALEACRLRLRKEMKR